MAEGTDHPAAIGGGTASTPSESITAQPDPGLLPPVGAEPEPYQPLSMLAIAALGLASLYAAIVIVGGLFAFISRSPWLLPIWFIVLFPVLATGIAYVARYRINRSEATLSGLALTKWAIGLSATVGIIYVFYYLGTYFAVRTQARTFTDRWLQQIAAEKIEEAFHETTKPPRKILENDLRRTLELQFNNPPQEGGQGGAFSRFTQSDYVRLLRMAGPKAKIEPTGLKDWEYEKGGFVVQLTYRITTDLATFPMQVTVHGTESPTREYTGRQWSVMIDGTGRGGQESGIHYSPEGEKVLGQALSGRVFADTWIGALANGNIDFVFEGTQEPALRNRKDRADLRKSYLWNRLSLGLVPVSDGPQREYLEARKALISGELIRKEKPVFWTADERLDAEVLAESRSVFDPGNDRPRQIRPQQSAFPVIRSDEKRIRFGYDIQITLPRDPAAIPKGSSPVPLLVDALLIVSADPSEFDSKRDPWQIWRIESVELVRGRNAPTAPQPPGAPRPGG